METQDKVKEMVGSKRPNSNHQTAQKERNV